MPKTDPSLGMQVWNSVRSFFFELYLPCFYVSEVLFAKSVFIHHHYI